MIRSTWKPILLLMVLAPLLAEVVSGATPVTRFVLPGIFLPYVTVLYGLPVLVLREVAVRRGYGPAGLWCLGVLYALYNEGLLAETLWYPLDMPMPAFDAYGVVAGVRVPFLVWIGCWHGLFSVLTPVVIVHARFRAVAARPWLPGWATAGLGLLLLGLAVARRPAMAGVALVLGAALWFAARRLPRTFGAGRRPVLAGVALYLLMVTVPEVLAQDGAPWPLVVAYLAVVVAAAGRLLVRRGDAPVLRFVLGANAAQAALAVPFGLAGGDPVWAATGAVFAVLFVLGCRR